VSAETVQSHQPHPFWQVQAVFDPDGLGGDFAYTIGLHSVGLPELHLWARPTCGDDPAPDWKFSSRDLGELLNEFAGMQLGGDLVAGSVVERSYDGGMAGVRFEVGSPGDRAALQAFGIARGALVLPIRWSLDRGHAGEPRELDDEARQEGQAGVCRVGSAARTGRSSSGLEDLRATAIHDAATVRALDRARPVPSPRTGARRSISFHGTERNKLSTGSATGGRPRRPKAPHRVESEEFP